MDIEIKDIEQGEPEVLIDYNDIDSLNSVEIIVEDDNEEEKAPEIKETKAEERPQEAQEEDDFQEEKENSKKKKSPRLSAKTRKIYNENKSLKNTVYTIYEENKALKEKAYQSERKAALWHEESLKNKAYNARQAIEQAREEGDIEKELDAQKYFLQNENELLNLKNKPQQPTYDEPEDIGRYLQYEPQDSLNADQEEWLIENDWYDNTSPNYDPDLATDAYQYDQYLSKKYKLQKRTNEIGTREYLDEISTYIHNKYLGNQRVQDEYDNGDEMEDEQIEVKPKAKPRQPVAPVNRAGSTSSYTNKPTSSRSVSLTKEEIDMALRMDYGTPMTSEQKKKIWADYKYRGQKSGQL
jgi:hypothetical protein